MRWLYHLTLAPEGPLRPAPGESFIHCSFGPAVAKTARLYFPANATVFVLKVDPRRLSAQVELASTPRGPMPHVHGVIEPEAIVERVAFSPMAQWADVVPVRVVAMGDTHGYHQKLVVPEGDLLIHVGDLTQEGTLDELEEVRDWLRSLPHRHKLLIAGNHDFAFERTPAAARELFEEFTYLEDAETTLCGLRIWGSPWQPWFYDWAFNLRRGEEIDAKWRLIPEGLDLLVTHGPPAGYGDRCYDGRLVGCADLLRHLELKAPRFHLFGHIHEDRGQWTVGASQLLNVTTSECDLPVTVFEA